MYSASATYIVNKVVTFFILCYVRTVNLCLRHSVNVQFNIALMVKMTE